MGKGTGDLYIRANCGIIFSEIYAIVDGWLYSSNEVSNTSEQTRYFPNYTMQNTSDWELTAQIKSNQGLIALSVNPNVVEQSGTPTRYIGVGANTGNNKLSALGFESVDNSIWVTNGSWDTSTYHNVKITRVGNLYSFYIDGSLHASTTSVAMGNYSQLYVFGRYWNNKSFSMKNILIKPL